MPAPEHAVIDAGVALGRALRGTGLRAGVDEELVFCRALAEIDVRSRAHLSLIHI